MSLLELSLFAATIVNIGIGCWTLYIQPRRITSFALFLFAVGLGLWVGSFFLLLYTRNFAYDKLNHYAGLLFIGGLFLLSLTFPDKPFRARYLTAFIPFLIGAVFVAHGGVVLSDTFGPGDVLTPTQGPFFPYYASGLLAYMLVSIILFARTYRKLEGVERLRMKYLFLGIIIFIVPVCIFDIALPAVGFPYLNLIGPIASAGFTGATAYAVLRHQLMDIRVVIQRGTIYTVLVSLVIAMYIGTMLFLTNLFDASGAVAAPISAGIVIVISLVTVPRIDRYFRKVTNRFFFKDRYDYADALESLSGILRGNIKLRRLANALVSELNDIFKPTIIVFTHATSGRVFATPHHGGIQEQPKGFPDGMMLDVSTRKRSLGTFVFGPKRSGDPYTAEDHRLLRTFATQAAVAFENTELYEQLKSYSESLEEKVADRTKNLAELQQRQRELFDDISHALQTPLTVIKSSVESIKDDPGSESEVISSIERSTDNLSSLIAQILYLARIDALPPEEEMQAIDLSSLLEHVVEYVETTCRQNGIRISKDLEPHISMAGNAKQLEEVFTNLLSNAVRYTEGCAVREINVKLRASEDALEATISDTGVGIPEDQLSYIFERFYRVGGTPASGHGLGLAITKRLVERHGGTIRATSEPGKGTVFTMRFPSTKSRPEAGGHAGATPS